jgi:lipoprotein-anchoring transpeptidase ErfK/SrfK
MDVDYVALLTKAVAGKDAAARGQIYRDAYVLIGKSNLTREAAAAHVAALDSAIQQIEGGTTTEIESDPTPEEARSAAEIDEVLQTGGNRKLLALGALAVVAVAVVSALTYGYFAIRKPSAISAGDKAQRGRAEVVVADVKPGTDGGSTDESLPFALRRQVVFFRTTVAPGSIVIDRENRFLYLIDSNNSARRYGIGIAQECLKGGSLFRVTSKLEWPAWRTSGGNTKDDRALLAAAGGPGSPLGSRALLLDKPGLLIHGTNSPNTIGHLVASGCIRLVNDDVEDLYRRVSLETRVVFLS